MIFSDGENIFFVYLLKVFNNFFYKKNPHLLTSFLYSCFRLERLFPQALDTKSVLLTHKLTN